MGKPNWWKLIHRVSEHDDRNETLSDIGKANERRGWGDRLADLATAIVTAPSPPTANAGNDLVVCGGNYPINLNGAVTNAASAA